jgi:hypothetical protein
MGQVLDFCNTCQFWVFEKSSESKNHQFQVYENFQIQKTNRSGFFLKNQIQRTTGSGCFKNFKEPPGFHEKLAKTQPFLGGHLIFSQKH